MRRLIHLTLGSLLGIRDRAARQHIADLERMLAELKIARNTIDKEIAETNRRLVAARNPGKQAMQTSALSTDHPL